VTSSDENREVEIKLRVAGVRAARGIVRGAGFQVLRRRVFEDNVVFDTPGLTLRMNGRLLRVRQAGPTATLTYKGRPAPGKHKSREELELQISDAREAALILERLGFAAVFRYQKYRTEYTRPRERGIVTLDETPIGCFLEIEGTPRWIDQTGRRLGFQETDYITASYGTLYRQYCEANGVEPADMVFPGLRADHADK
jgi:adenylate cyclase class 2